MPNSREHDRNARSKFNEEAAASLQHHQSDLDDSIKAADKAVNDLQARKQLRRQRVESINKKSLA